jgi:hypothetical protein
MSTLKRGSKGKKVVALQSALNKVGAMLVPDGDFGPGTERGVFYAQDIADQPVTGIADPNLWNWLDHQPIPYDPLHTNGIAFDQDHLSKSRRQTFLQEVEDQILSMKRLWAPGSGRIKRRQAEANLWREGLSAW